MKEIRITKIKLKFLQLFKIYIITIFIILLIYICSVASKISNKNIILKYLKYIQKKVILNHSKY
jgi:hypothetical protein